MQPTELAQRALATIRMSQEGRRSRAGPQGAGRRSGDGRARPRIPRGFRCGSEWPSYRVVLSVGGALLAKGDNDD